MASAQEVEMLRRQLDELTAQVVEVKWLKFVEHCDERCNEQYLQNP